MNSWRRPLTLLWQFTLARVAVGGLVGVAAVGSYGALGGTVGGLGIADASAKVARLVDLPDPSAILGARSPGGRDAGAMFTTKPARQRLASRPRVPLPSAPRERVLSNVRERPSIGWAPPYVELPATPLAFGPATPIGDVPLTPVALGPLPPGGGFTPTTPFVPGGGGGGNGGGGGGGDEVIPPVPAVPEPATWATMILGFLMVGAALRRVGRRGAAEAKPAA
ncbi:PEPxxWA-CTERM sorting domain-containing protein [Sphingomonas sp. DT-51]|uniref:PEPxxWA-CTERM sorting domain-containing protein n=1 Tax=Sphingomonas sp. DT-51 TaxID=3396165 RepID=UPI003F1B9867